MRRLPLQDTFERKWDGNKQAINKTCLGCHDADESVHGAAVAKGNKDAPSCADCHGLHLIKPIGDKPGGMPANFTPKPATNATPTLR